MPIIRVKTPQEHKDAPDIIIESVGRLAWDAFKRWDCRKKQKIGESYDVIEKGEFEFFMCRVAKDWWKICFHTLKAKSPTIDEDPQ